MPHDNPSAMSPLNGRKISEIVMELSDTLQAPTVTIGELRDALSGRIYGIFLLILALPNLIPLPAPGLSAVLGMPLLLLTIQLTLGMEKPWFPQSVMQRSIRTVYLHRLCRFIMPYLIRVERCVVPRWMWLVHYPLNRVISVVCVLLSLMIMLPIPFGNALPALAICCFSVALLQRDGVFVVLGLIVSALAITVAAAALMALLLLLNNMLFS